MDTWTSSFAFDVNDGAWQSENLENVRNGVRNELSTRYLLCGHLFIQFSARFQKPNRWNKLFSQCDIHFDELTYQMLAFQLAQHNPERCVTEQLIKIINKQIKTDKLIHMHDRKKNESVEKYVAKSNMYKMEMRKTKTSKIHSDLNMSRSAVCLLKSFNILDGI